MMRRRRCLKQQTRPVCEACGDVIDDWEAPTGFRVDGLRVCRWCYLERVEGAGGNAHEERGDNDA